MSKYYKKNGSIFEDIGHNTLRCIASTRKRMINVYIINGDLSSFYQYDSEGEALESLKEDAYWNNDFVFQRT